MRDRPRILVAEDHEDSLIFLRDRLARAYEVLTAADGLQALATAREAHPDLILLDVMMPGLDGFEVCRRLKADSSLPFMPIIMVTARTASEDVVAGLEAGADEYLSKPVNPDALIARVRSMLRIKDLHDRLEDLNQTLEVRVDQQVDELERLGRLRGYVSSQVAELIVSSGGKLLEPHRGEIVVVFCDLRGYTGFADTAEAEIVIEVLQDYHRALGPVILEYEGTLERFTGDGLMIFFNDPVTFLNPAERAVRMAVAMRESAGQLSLKWQEQLDYTLGFGIGIDQGYATMGRIGFEGRFDYAALGRVTNRSARLCSDARDGQILVSQRVHASVRELVDIESLGLFELKGFHDPVRVYNVLSLK